VPEHRRRFDDGEVGLSVVVPTRNRSSILGATLRRLIASEFPRPWEIVVVANACTDDTAAAVARVAAEGRVSVRLVEEPRPSASVARNRGALAAVGRLLVFLDDDILLEPDVLGTIWDWHENTPGTALLVGQILPLAQHLATPFGAFRQQTLGDVSLSIPPHEVDWFASGLAAMSAKTFGDLGGYAESYPAAGLEDADLAIRARRADHRIIFHPAVVGHHNDWAGTTARDYCRRAAAHTATAPLLARRFPDNDHPWGRLIEVNRPAVAADPRSTRVRKGLKQAAVAVAADRWLPALADRAPLPRGPRELAYRASVSLAMFAGYQRGLRRLTMTGDVTTHSERRPTPAGEHVLSIVIVTFNCGDEVERAIDSLQRHPPSASFEIVVIDNASRDDTPVRLRRRYPQVKVMALDENIGYGSAVNLAVEETDGQYLLLLNPDTEVTQGAIDVLLRQAEATADAGVVGPRLVLGSGAPQPSARRLPSPWRLWFEVLRLHLLLPAPMRGRLLAGTYSAQDEPGRVDWVSGACHLVPRAVWQRVGGLTERTFCGFDDLDYCWRARAAGFDTWFCPDSVFVHHCGVSVSRRWTPREVDRLAIHNAYVVLEDHWPRHRVKLYCAAEVAGTLSDVVLGGRRHGLTALQADSYRGAAGERLRLLTQLLTGRLRPITRHEPGRAANEVTRAMGTTGR